MYDHNLKFIIEISIKLFDAEMGHSIILKIAQL